MILSPCRVITLRKKDEVIVLPTYGYQCTQCKHEFSVFQSMKDDPIAVCPTCTGAVKRLLYPVGIVFKGSGWYINDSRKPDTSESATPAASDSKNGDAKSGDSKSDSKTESKAEATSESKSDSSADSKSDAKPVASATN